MLTSDNWRAFTVIYPNYRKPKLREREEEEKKTAYFSVTTVKENGHC